MDRINEVPFVPVELPSLQVHEVAATPSIYYLDIPNKIPVLPHVMLDSHHISNLQHSQFLGALIVASLGQLA